MQRFDGTTDNEAADRGLNCFPSPRRIMPGHRGIEPGDAAPQFDLPNANSSMGGKSMSLSDVMGENGAIIAFTCNHCPYVVGSESRIENIASKAASSGMGFAGINSNDPVNYDCLLYTSDGCRRRG